MADLNEVVGALLGNLVTNLEKVHPSDPDVHLYLNKPTNKITITVEFPAHKDIEKIGADLLLSINGYLKTVK